MPVSRSQRCDQGLRDRVHGRIRRQANPQPQRGKNVRSAPRNRHCASFHPGDRAGISTAGLAAMIEIGWDRLFLLCSAAITTVTSTRPPH
jgi:hypothetical protein